MTYMYTTHHTVYLPNVAHMSLMTNLTGSVQLTYYNECVILYTEML